MSQVQFENSYSVVSLNDEIVERLNDEAILRVDPCLHLYGLSLRKGYLILTSNHVFLYPRKSEPVPEKETRSRKRTTSHDAPYEQKISCGKSFLEIPRSRNTSGGQFDIPLKNPRIARLNQGMDTGSVEYLDGSREKLESNSNIGSMKSLISARSSMLSMASICSEKQGYELSEILEQEALYDLPIDHQFDCYKIGETLIVKNHKGTLKIQGLDSLKWLCDMQTVKGEFLASVINKH